ncbi:MAG: amidohydrolase [Chthonomonadales bacterium]
MQTLFVNAKICTMDAACPWADAMLCGGERILAVGSLTDLAERAAHDARHVDLDGCLVVPGFNDSHMHVLGYGLTLQEADLSPQAGVTSVALLLDALQRWAASHVDYEWIVGNGYYQEALEERRHPTCAELDAVFPNRPVVIFHASGHALVANSIALRLAGIGRDTPDPPGGQIGRDASGPTGLLLEAAMPLLEGAMPTPNRAQMQEAIRSAAAALARRGLTAASDMSVGWFHLEEEIAAYRHAADQGIPLRVTISPLAARLGSPDAIPPKSEFAASAGLEDDRSCLRLGPLKLFADGAITTRTAALREAFTNGALGILTHPPQELEDYVLNAHRNGWQLAVHAIGDRAIDLVLACFRKAQSTGTPGMRRHRIEHCMVLDEALIARIAALGVVPALQMEFLMRLGDAYVAALGAERATRLNPAASLLKASIPVAFGSDCPVVPGHPLDGIRAAVERTTASGVVLGSSERITPLDALSCYTKWSAYAAFDEANIGVLAPGRRADATVLHGTGTVESIAGARVIGTIFGGEFVDAAPHRPSSEGCIQ